ncbi:MAG: cytochrome c [Paenibacillaceae bacterium]
MYKWTMFGVFCAACLLGLSILFTTIPEEGSHEEAAPVAEAPLNVEAATAVYEKSCLMCHGDQLQGGGGPMISDVGSRLDEQQIAGKIENGIGGMPSFKTQLTSAEISNLAKWLSEKK